MTGKLHQFTDNLVNIGTITRAEAIKSGLSRFNTGKPCCRGHMSDRYVAGGACIQCNEEHCVARYAEHREDAKQRQREWNAKNREQSNAMSRKWHAEHRDEANARRAAWRKAHPEHTKEKMRAYYEAHGDELRAYSLRWAAEHPEQTRTQVREWHRKHKGEPRYEARRFIKNMLTGIVRGKDEKYSHAIGYTSDKLVNHLEQMFESWMTWENHGSEWHIDHIIPIACFLDHGITDPKIVNALWNLRPLEAHANMRKQAKVSYKLMDRIKADHGVDVRMILQEASANG